jgi:hypothetical protein
LHVVAGSLVASLTIAASIKLMNAHVPRQISYRDAWRAFLIAVGSGLTTKRGKSAAEYDDQQAVDTYVVKFWERHLGESERRWYSSGLRLAKAQAQLDTPWGQQVVAEWQSSTDQELRAALADGFEVLEERLWQKVLAGFRTGALRVNRCPHCQRVVRTPRARQCLWCGSDWH